MKTSVTKIMMSFALMGCLVLSASDAMAQGRSRSHGGSTSSRSQTAAVSRSKSSHAPSVSTNSSRSHSSASPQVTRSTNRSTTPKVSHNSTSRVSTTRSSATPQVNRNSGSNRPTTTVRPDNSGSSKRGSGTRTDNGSITRGSRSNSGSSSNGTMTRRSDNTPKVGTTSSPTRTDRNANVGDFNNRGNNKGNKDNRGGMGNDKGNKGNRDGMGNNNGRNGNHGNNGNHNGHNGKRDNMGNRNGHNGGYHGNHNGYSPKNRFDYSNHHYRNEFHRNYTHHNWGRPLPPPYRAHRHAPWRWYRPVIPAGWHPYAGAPIIDRILGLMFGSLYDVSLNYLYSSGYYIDGYSDGIIYLRDVPMLNMYWPDVMLNYDLNRLVNAQFVYYDDYYNLSRYNAAYNSLCRIYGSPVFSDGMTISWYGGNSQGYVTLSMAEDYGGYYTTLSIGY